MSLAVERASVECKLCFGELAVDIMNDDAVDDRMRRNKEARKGSVEKVELHTKISNATLITGADLAPSQGGGCRFSMGWCMREPYCPCTLLCSLQGYYPNSQHYHYLRWPNLRVCRSVTFYTIFCSVIKFMSAFYTYV